MVGCSFKTLALQKRLLGAKYGSGGLDVAFLRNLLALINLAKNRISHKPLMHMLLICLGN
jgi:hypothetical protein